MTKAINFHAHPNAIHGAKGVNYTHTHRERDGERDKWKGCSAFLLALIPFSDYVHKSLQAQACSSYINGILPFPLLLLKGESPLPQFYMQTTHNQNSRACLCSGCKL